MGEDYAQAVGIGDVHAFAPLNDNWHYYQYAWKCYGLSIISFTFKELS